jgi:hypothetical protein
MTSGIDRLVCGREEDLVGFLYDELDEAEAGSFRSHMRDCAACSAEVTALGNIRHSVIDWRNESLSAQSHAALGNYIPLRPRSAAAAIREFFNLSPVWMKAAVGFASVLFCIFAVLAVSGLRKTPSPIVTTAGENKPSLEEIDAMVERRVKDELNRRNAQPEYAAAQTDQESAIVPVSATNHRKRVANPSRPDARRPLTRVEREQLAADLRLIPGTNDIELELLDDAINH